MATEVVCDITTLSYTVFCRGSHGLAHDWYSLLHKNIPLMVTNRSAQGGRASIEVTRGE